MPLETPVVSIIFNRPGVTGRVLAEIAKARPPALWVIADGPRPNRPGEKEKVAETRALVEQFERRLNWPCQVRRNFSETNLGCKKRVATGLDWAFSGCEQAIILEDDCLPTGEFFNFCQELLDRYREDRRVMSIGGINFQDGRPRSTSSYYFTKYFHCWGWASWRRAWQHYDLSMQSWPEFKALGGLHTFADTDREEAYWDKTLTAAYDDQIDTWDYALFYSWMTQRGLQILPNANLVSNLGFGDGATHTTNQDGRLAEIPHGHLGSLRHPPFVIRNKEADRYTFDHCFSPPRPRGWKKLVSSLRKRVRRLSS